VDTSFAAELYEKVKVTENESADLSAYCDSIGEMFKEVELLAREDADGNLPWSKITDPELAFTELTDPLATYALLWLAQLAGVRIPIGLAAADEMRAIIELAEARRRGTVLYMVEVAQRLLTGDKFVWMQERDGSAYQLSIVTRTAETPDEDAVRAALLVVKPAGIVLTYTVSDGVTWDEPVHAWNAAGSVTWDETVTVTP
jgi:hypothetical protein